MRKSAIFKQADELQLGASKPWPTLEEHAPIQPVHSGRVLVARNLSIPFRPNHIVPHPDLSTVLTAGREGGRDVPLDPEQPPSKPHFDADGDSARLYSASDDGRLDLFRTGWGKPELLWNRDSKAEPVPLAKRSCRTTSRSAPCFLRTGGAGRIAFGPGVLGRWSRNPDGQARQFGETGGFPSEAAEWFVSVRWSTRRTAALWRGWPTRPIAGKRKPVASAGVAPARAIPAHKRRLLSGRIGPGRRHGGGYDPAAGCTRRSGTRPLEGRPGLDPHGGIQPGRPAPRRRAPTRPRSSLWDVRNAVSKARLKDP